MLRAGILGASGYGGAELIRRLARHAGVELSGFGSRQYEGQELARAWPQLAGTPLGSRRFADNDTVIGNADVIFFATPHAATAPLVAKARAAGKTAVDLSADFRLSAGAYSEWYGGTHPAPELLPEAVYGLVELHRNELPDAQLIASPGCNATAATLALAPLAAAGLLGADTGVTITTGISGAGRAPKQVLHFPEAMDSVVPYSTGGRHRHIAEIEANLGRLRAQQPGSLDTHGPQDPPAVTFTPVRVPTVRGILAVCSTRPPAGAEVDNLTGLYREFYAGSPLVHVQEGAPETGAVSGSDRALLSVERDRRTGMVLAFAVLDNLGKGAAGQAVQAFNIANGFAEAEGLQPEGRWP